MPYRFPPDVQETVRECMASGRYSSEDELLRDALRTLHDEEADDLAAVRAAIAEVDAGDPGISLDDAFDEIRRRHRQSGES